MLFSLLLGSWAQQQEKAEHGYDSGAFVHLVQCVCYSDPKVNKVLEVKPRSPNQQNIDVQLEAVHQPNCFPCPFKCHSRKNKNRGLRAVVTRSACLSALSIAPCVLFPTCRAQVLGTEHIL